MKITRISGPSGCGKSIAMSAICNDLESQGRAVLTALPGSTTASVLAMCTSPVPFAIFIPEYDPKLIDLAVLHAQPNLVNVWCYIEVEEASILDPNDPLDDILPISVPISFASGVAQGNGIVTLVPIELLIAADSEGGEHD